MINLTDCKVTEIFYIIDDFCKEFSKIEQKSAISDGKRHRNKPNKMSDAEVILILLSNLLTYKYFFRGTIYELTQNFLKTIGVNKYRNSDYFLSKQFFDDPNDNYDYDQGNDDI